MTVLTRRNRVRGGGQVRGRTVRPAAPGDRRRTVVCPRRAVSRPVEVSCGRRRPRSRTTASGVCSRTMKRATWLGTRCGVSSETPTIVSERERHGPGGGLAEQVGDPAGVAARRRRRQRRRATDAARRRRAGRRPRRRRSAVATRCRAPAAGRTSTPRPRRPGRPTRATPTSRSGQRQAEGYDDRDHGRDPERRDRPEPAAHDVLADHARHRDRQPRRGGQERRERTGRDERRQQLAADPADHPAGSSSTTVSARPLAIRSGA